MSQMDSALEFVNAVTREQFTLTYIRNDDLTDAVAHAERYIVQAMSPERLSEPEITKRARELHRQICSAVAEGKFIDALSFCGAPEANHG